MKKLFQIFVIISVIFFTGMQSANAQATVTVTWTLGQSDCHCHTLGDSIYIVSITIINTCTHPPSEVYNDLNYESGSASSSQFILNVDCDDLNNEKCYRVYAEVTKYCPDGQGGYTVECQGQGSNPYFWSCSDLQNSSVNIPVGTIIIQ